MASIPNPPTPIQDEAALNSRMQELVSHVLNGNQLGQANIGRLLDSLPHLTEDQVNAQGHRNSVCPICFTPLLAILAEQEIAEAMDSPAHPVENLGVTQLSICKHVFCRRDISRWIRDAHDSCPLCRGDLVVREESTPIAASTSATRTTDGPDYLERLVTDFEASHRPVPSSLGRGPASGHEEEDFLQRLVAEFEAAAAGGGRNSGPDTHNADRSEYYGMYS